MIIGVISVGSNVIFIIFSIVQGERISIIIVSTIGGISAGGNSVGGHVLFFVFGVGDNFAIAIAQRKLNQFRTSSIINIIIGE